MAVILHPRGTQTFSHFLFDVPDMDAISIHAFPPDAFKGDLPAPDPPGPSGTDQMGLGLVLAVTEHPRKHLCEGTNAL